MHGDGDGWVSCEAGHRHWGRFGAAGLLLRHSPGDGTRQVLLQHRVLWSHHGGTWGIPGGARDSHETVEQTALREAAEEAGLAPHGLTVRTVYADDHGGWSYATVVADCSPRLIARPTGAESLELRWVDVEQVTRLRLHPGFAATWPHVSRLS